MSLPVVIFAAGRGTRMKELSRTRPKHLIEVGGKPFLFYLLQNIWAAGLNDVYLVVGYQAKVAYDFVLGLGKNVKIINQFESLGEERYGTLMPLLAVEPELASKPLLAVSGDNLYSSADLKKVAQNLGSAVAYLEHPKPESYGVLVPKQNGFLDYILEKPQEPPSHFINTGLYRFSEKIWPVLPEVKKSARGEYELTDALNLLAKIEPVNLVKLDDFWFDFGRPEDIPLLEVMMREGKVK